MSDMVYHFLNVAEKMCYETFYHLYRGKETTFVQFDFRIDHTDYVDDGNDVGKSLFFNVRYHSNEGGSYVKVEWQLIDVDNGWKPGPWIELADHDSCWHGCWSDILSHARKILLEDFIVKGNESWYFNCENVGKYQKEDT